VKGRPFDNTVGRVKWAFSTGASALAPPGLGAGILHVLSDETLYAVVKGAGGGMWPASWMPFTANGPSQSRPSTVPLAVGPASRVIYLGSGNAAGNNAIAVDADTGLGLWGQPLGAPTGAGPAGIFTAYGGAYDYILLGNRKSGGGSAFFALDRTTGALAPGSWPYLGEPLNLPPNEIGIVSSQAALDRPNRRAYFTSYQRAPGVSDSVWCVDLDTAARCGGWTIGATSGLGDITASPTLQGGRLYVAALNAGNAEVHALDANDGVSQWASPFAPADGPVKLFILPDVFTHDFYFSTTDNVWSIRDDGGTATQRWARYLPGASQPVYFPYDRLVWVGGGDGQLYTLNRTDGSDAVPPVTLGDGSAPAGAPTVDSANGFVYVGTTAGVVYAVSIP
jgi:outer membrane protein assembly factor BamB